MLSGFGDLFFFLKSPLILFSVLVRLVTWPRIKDGTTIVRTAVKRAAATRFFFMVVCFYKDTIKAGAGQSDEYMIFGGLLVPAFGGCIYFRGLRMRATASALELTCNL